MSVGGSKQYRLTRARARGGKKSGLRECRFARGGRLPAQPVVPVADPFPGTGRLERRLSDRPVAGDGRDALFLEIMAQRAHGARADRSNGGEHSSSSHLTILVSRRRRARNFTWLPESSPFEKCRLIQSPGHDLNQAKHVVRLELSTDRASAHIGASSAFLR